MPAELERHVGAPCPASGKWSRPENANDTELRDDVEGRRPFGRLDLLRTVAVIALWAFAQPLWTAMVEGAPPLRVGAVAALFAGLGLLGVAGLRESHVRRLTPHRLEALVMIGFFSTSMGVGAMLFARGGAPAGLSTSIAAAQPLAAAALGGWFLAERLSRWRLAGLVVGYVGVVVLATQMFPAAHSALRPTAVISLGVAAIGMAAGNVVMKRTARDVEPVAAMGWQFVFGALPLFAASAHLEAEQHIPWSLSLLLLLSVVAALGMALPAVIWFKLLRRYDLSQLNVFTYVGPALSAGLAAILFGASLMAFGYVGAAVTIVGVWFVAART